MVDYEIITAGTKDKENLYNVLVDSFYPDMPLFRACKVFTPPTIDKWPALQKLEEGLTLAAISSKGEIKGVAINVAPNEKMPIPGPTILGHFWDYFVHDSKGLVTELERNVMELRILTVSKDFRGRGVAKRLIKESECLAKRLEYSSIFAMATGAYVESAFIRNGWNCMYTMMYKDYAAINSDFQLPESPNDRVTLYIKHF